MGMSSREGMEALSNVFAVSNVALSFLLSDEELLARFLAWMNEESRVAGNTPDETVTVDMLRADMLHTEEWTHALSHAAERQAEAQDRIEIRVWRI